MHNARHVQGGMATPFSGFANDSALASFQIARAAATADAVHSSTRSMLMAFSLLIVVVVGKAGLA